MALLTEFITSFCKEIFFLRKLKLLWYVIQFLGVPNLIQCSELGCFTVSFKLNIKLDTNFNFIKEHRFFEIHEISKLFFSASKLQGKSSLYLISNGSPIYVRSMCQTLSYYKTYILRSKFQKFSTILFIISYSLLHYIIFFLKP